MENRKKELMLLVGEDNKTLIKLVDDICFLEEQLEYLRKLPQIKVNPINKEQQKTTPASKQYKECLQQYTNCIKLLIQATGEDNNEDISPLRRWAEKFAN